MDDSLFGIFPCGSGWRFPSAMDVHLGTCLTASAPALLTVAD